MKGAFSMSRVIWIVLDSVGMGNAPDAEKFGDAGANTIGHIMLRFPDLRIPNLRRIGYGNIDGMENMTPAEHPEGAFGRLAELSAGKDTTIGHWEMTGIHTPKPFPVYPDGFPQDVIDEFVRRTGVPGILYNGVASGTVIIEQYGEEHLKTKKPIIYTSADSVFQIACNEDIYPPEKLYEMCRIAREILTGDHNVARVIARPFVRTGSGWARTPNRRDFSCKPKGDFLLKRIIDAGQTVYAVGKIEDIFAAEGISEAVHTRDNMDGMDKTMDALGKVDRGLIFTNLVEFDSSWGHRRDVADYARGLEDFDSRLGPLMDALGPEDTIVITADHGCDPTYQGTDHTRECVPFLLYGPQVKPGVNLGTGTSFADSGETVRNILGVNVPDRPLPIGRNRWPEIRK